MTKSSQDITAGMVTVRHEDHNELAFTAWMDIRIKRVRERESQSSSSHNSSFQSEPGLIESNTVDKKLIASQDSEPKEDLRGSLQGFEGF